MKLSDKLEFGHEDRRLIYEYIESHGAVTPKELERTLRVDPSGLKHHIAILKRDGLIEVADDKLLVSIEAGTEEEFTDEGVDYTIRPARQEDLTGLVGAIRQVSEEKTYIVGESVADVIDHEEVLLRHNELESRMFFVACVNREVVGWVHLSAPELEKLGHTAELTVGVIDEYRGHGIGSHLLHRGLEWAGENGFEKIYNSVPSTNTDAIQFLETHDWEIEATRAKHYKLGDTYIDEVMMAVRL
ncbi:GNAT family N-acetyltransferase [Haladaptatus sp. DJG-WS-42]|uniref:GNAT family N-acetyltransferase n=1 Tax=Haladaptatus sp. DJG-WS-42 TaxID=3120516 RepID=UPI0030D09AE5